MFNESTLVKKAGCNWLHPAFFTSVDSTNSNQLTRPSIYLDFQ